MRLFFKIPYFIASLIICAIIFIPKLSIAWNPLETTAEAKERRAAERYYQRQDNPLGELGGYSSSTTIEGDSKIDYSSSKNRRDSSQDYSPFETVEHSQERHRTQRYEERQNNPYQMEPLGGYSEKLGDPAPSSSYKSISVFDTSSKKSSSIFDGDEE